MSGSSKDGTHMKSRSRKVMIITVIGMIIMIANGQGDQRTEGKEKTTNYLENIEHKYNTQKETSKLESSNGSHEINVHD